MAQSICIILLVTFQSLKKSIIFLLICWLIFLFGIGAVSQISLRNVALHFRKYQTTLSMLLLTLGDVTVTAVGYICKKNDFPTNNNRAIDELIIVIIIYLIPMWISFFITFFADFEKDPIDNTEVQQLTFGEYVKELKLLYEYAGLAKTMLIEFFITIISFFLVQIIYSYSDYFSDTDTHCPQLANYFKPGELRNISWFACMLFAILFDLDYFSFKNSVRIINFSGAILSFLTILIAKLIKESFNILQMVFICQYFLICGFYSILLGKTLRIFSPAKMMEVTGFIGIAPLLAKIGRMCFEEFFGFVINVNTINNAIQKKCDKIDASKSYVRFGAWLYYKLDYAWIFYLFFGIFSIAINIFAIYYIKFVPEIEVPFDKATIEELQQKPEKVESSSFEYKEDKGEEED